MEKARSAAGHCPAALLVMPASGYGTVVSAAAVAAAAAVTARVAVPAAAAEQNDDQDDPQAATAAKATATTIIAPHHRSTSRFNDRNLELAAELPAVRPGLIPYYAALRRWCVLHGKIAGRPGHTGAARRKAKVLLTPAQKRRCIADSRGHAARSGPRDRPAPQYGRGPAP